MTNLISEAVKRDDVLARSEVCLVFSHLVTRPIADNISIV